MTSAAQRRAALTLHALSPGDREWIVAQLPPPQRARIEALLGELRALHIPADPTILAAPAAAPAPTIAPPAPVLTAASLAQLLVNEPAYVAAAALRDRPEAERDAVLSAWPPARAGAVRTLLASPVADAFLLRKAVRTELLARVQRAPSAAAAPATTPRRLVRWRSTWARLVGAGAR